MAWKGILLPFIPMSFNGANRLKNHADSLIFQLAILIGE